MSTLSEVTLEQTTRVVSKFTYRSKIRHVLVAVRWPVGGIRTHIIYNYSSTEAQGYHFTFVGPADATFDTFAAGLKRLPDCEFVGAPVRGAGCQMISTVRRLLSTGRFSLMHSHGLTAAVQAAVANFGIGLPHIATVHDPLRPEQFPGLRGRLKRLTMGYILRNLNSAVCVSNDIRCNLLEYLPILERSRCRLVTIPNGIDISSYTKNVPPPTTELRRCLNLGSEVKLVGFLGRFMVQKGFLPLLEAVERLVKEGPPQPFHLVAVGSGDYEREYRAEIERRGLRSHISMLDFVMDVRPVLCQLDLLVVPSLWEASSLLSMEAMATGVPILGTDCIGLREVLRDTPSRVVAAGDSKALHHGLREALTEPRTELARDFAAVARARFDNEPSAQRLFELFGQLERPLAKN